MEAADEDDLGWNNWILQQKQQTTISDFGVKFERTTSQSAPSSARRSFHTKATIEPIRGITLPKPASSLVRITPPSPVVKTSDSFPFHQINPSTRLIEEEVGDPWETKWKLSVGNAIVMFVLLLLVIGAAAAALVVTYVNGKRGIGHHF